MMLVSEGDGWNLDAEKCPADHDFVQWLDAGAFEWQNVFHMGTGLHHHVGRTLATNGRCNSVMAINNSVAEMRAYEEWAMQFPALTRWYKVFFGDIHMLNERQLPRFDIVSLFHIGEMSCPGPYAYLSIEDVVSMFVDKLNEGGRLVFYRRSAAWDRVAPVIESMSGWESEEFASLIILRRV